jgi:DNA-binding GntR family transcriptional regulator
VIEQLREAIVGFEYEPGQRLVERDLCERFSVSRTVIREALRHLEAEGIVALIPNRGPIVASLSPDDVKHIYEMREVVEALAARLCSERATQAQRRQLTRALERISAAYKKPDFLEGLRAQDAFYRILTEGAANPLVASTIRSIHARVQLLRALSLHVEGRAEESLAEMAEVVAAIEARDLTAAAEAAALHVRKAEAAALSKLGEMPGSRPAGSPEQ